MDPDFGCDVHAYLFDVFDKDTIDKIAEEIFKSFIQYEPRIKIETINRNLNYDTLQYTLEINYKFVNKNEQGKFTVVLQKL
jgi:phage baseplate assembly protein W